MTQWWPLVALLTVNGALIAYVVGPPAERPPSAEYAATHVLVLSDGPNRQLTTGRVNLALTVGKVPATAASVLGYQDASALLQEIGTDQDANLGTVMIRTVQPERQKAAEVVDTLAGTYLLSLRAEAQRERDLTLAELTQERSEIEAQLAAMELSIGSTQDEALRQALIAAFADVLRQEQALRDDLRLPVESVAQATVLERPVAGFKTPLTLPIMGLVGAVVGLGFALGMLIVIDRVRNRILTREDAEAAFGSSILVDVPRLSGRRRPDNSVVTIDEPEAPVSTAYRRLRTMSSAILRRADDSEGSESDEETRGSVLLVTSAGQTDGKTTTVANLAAAYADSGDDVIVVSGDLRLPTIHRFLGVDHAAPGLLHLAANSSQTTVASALHDTTLPRVRLLAHGERVDNPGELLASRRSVIEKCRELANVVLVDAPPALVGNDVAELLPAVDAVILVARVQHTRVSYARATRRLLRSLDAETLGITLIGSADDNNVMYKYGTSRAERRQRQVSSIPHARIASEQETADLARVEDSAETESIAQEATAVARNGSRHLVSTSTGTAWSRFRSR